MNAFTLKFHKSWETIRNSTGNKWFAYGIISAVTVFGWLMSLMHKDHNFSFSWLFSLMSIQALYFTVLVWQPWIRPWQRGWLRYCDGNISSDKEKWGTVCKTYHIKHRDQGDMRLKRKARNMIRRAGEILYSEWRLTGSFSRHVKRDIEAIIEKTRRGSSRSSRTPRYRRVSFFE